MYLFALRSVLTSLHSHLGQVVPGLAKWTPLLKNKPDIMNKPWVKERVVSLLQRLVDSQVDTRCKLIAQWKENKRCTHPPHNSIVTPLHLLLHVSLLYF